jgi:hypothetical protein
LINIWDVTGLRGFKSPSSSSNPLPLTSTVVTRTLGSTAPLFWAESDVSNLTHDVSLLDTSTVLVGKGCWSIFISFSSLVAVPNSSLHYSIVDWICCLKILQSLVSCEVALCDLQYLVLFSSFADDMVWNWESLICPWWSNRSNILSALVMSKPNQFLNSSDWPTGLDSRSHVMHISPSRLAGDHRKLVQLIAYLPSSNYSTCFWLLWIFERIQPLFHHSFAWALSWETWVPMGPHRPGSRRSLSSGPNLSEASGLASGPRDLIHKLGNLGRSRTTSSRLRKICRACGASLSLRSWCSTASRSEDREILFVITEGWRTEAAN